MSPRAAATAAAGAAAGAAATAAVPPVTSPTSHPPPPAAHKPTPCLARRCACASACRLAASPSFRARRSISSAAWLGEGSTIWSRATSALCQSAHAPAASVRRSLVRTALTCAPRPPPLPRMRLEPTIARVACSTHS